MHQTSPKFSHRHASLRALTFFAGGLFFPCSILAQAPAPADAPGTLTGYVSNQATGDLLRSASVQLPKLGRTEPTDDTGRYLFRGLPAGEYEIVASYAGLDPLAATVTIRAGATSTQNFDLTSTVYRLGEFKVSADREGAAATLTAQKNANNTKNIIALDSYGDLPNLSVAELAGLMPGVALNFSDDGVANGIMVRGASAALNRVTIDGGLKAGSGASRQFPSAQFTGAGFAEVELTKGHRPDTGADSLGGTVNLKSRSPLSMKERRRIDYTASIRYAAPFTDQVAWREEHRAHPLSNVGYQESSISPAGSGTSAFPLTRSTARMPTGWRSRIAFSRTRLRNQHTTMTTGSPKNTTIVRSTAAGFSPTTGSRPPPPIGSLPATSSITSLRSSSTSRASLPPRRWARPGLPVSCPDTRASAPKRGRPPARNCRRRTRCIRRTALLAT